MKTKEDFITDVISLNYYSKLELLIFIKINKILPYYIYYLKYLGIKISPLFQPSNTNSESVFS